MKCSHGQTWNSATNTCDGSGTSIQYCSTNTDNCNGGVATNELGVGGFLSGATSSAYNACINLNSGVGTFGKTNWRVPTFTELKLLINCTNKSLPNDSFTCTGPIAPTINNLFPFTATSSEYVSSTPYLSNSAKMVNFNTSFSGSISMNSSFYLRCVSGP